jgi:hypothetical protein
MIYGSKSAKAIKNLKKKYQLFDEMLLALPVIKDT